MHPSWPCAITHRAHNTPRWPRTRQTGRSSRWSVWRMTMRAPMEKSPSASPRAIGKIYSASRRWISRRLVEFHTVGEWLLSIDRHLDSINQSGWKKINLDFLVKFILYPSRWLIDWLTYWFIVQMIDWLIDYWSIFRFFDPLIDWLIDWMCNVLVSSRFWRDLCEFF